MLKQVLQAKQGEILSRFRKRAYEWSTTPEVEAELAQQVSTFLHQIESLLSEADAIELTENEIARVAAGHARSLLRHGFPLAQAINDYGDVCRVISEVAAEEHEPLSETEVEKLSVGSVAAILAVAGEYASGDPHQVFA